MPNMKTEHCFEGSYTKYYEYDGGEMSIDLSICTRCGVEEEKYKKLNIKCEPYEKQKKGLEGIKQPTTK